MSLYRYKERDINKYITEVVYELSRTKNAIHNTEIIKQITTYDNKIYQMVT
jgi:hypothetical protein